MTKKKETLELRLLRKVKLNRNLGLTVAWEEHHRTGDEDHSVVTEERTSDTRVHEDMITAMKPFVEHIGLITEQLSSGKKRPPFDGTLKGAEQFKARGIIVRGGIGDNPLQVGVSGLRSLKSGRVVNIMTPMIRLDTAQEPYPFATDMREHVDVLLDEVWGYLFNGKCTPADEQLSVQMAIGDGSEEEEEEQEG